MITGQVPNRQRIVADEWVVLLLGESYSVSVVMVEGGYGITQDGKSQILKTGWKLGETLFRGRFGDKLFCLQVERVDIAYRLTHGGTEVDVLVMNPHAAELQSLMPGKTAADTSKTLLSPMPGLLVSVAVYEGQDIKAGDELAVVEAMKMETVLRAERDGIVSAIKAAPGDSLAVDQVILEFE